MPSFKSLLKPVGLGLLLIAGLSAAETPKITPQKALLGANIGDDYFLANYTQISAAMKKWDSESDRMTVGSIGKTEEGREQLDRLRAARAAALAPELARLSDEEREALRSATEIILRVVHPDDRER